MGGRGSKSVSSKVAVMSLSEYLGLYGVSDVLSDYTTDKTRLPHGETERQRKQRLNSGIQAIEDYKERREAAKKEYEQKVAAGEIRPPTKIEELIRTARGHSDNASVQAARRLLEKRGIDWRNYKF